MKLIANLPSATRSYWDSLYFVGKNGVSVLAHAYGECHIVVSTCRDDLNDN